MCASTGPHWRPHRGKHLNALHHNVGSFYVKDHPLVLFQDTKQQDFYLGSVPVSARTEWTSLDSLIAKTFKVRLSFA